ncbi:hypothetical protein D9599_10775 [Roseomonas sp. KE2513]|nr:hypothetical protein [Roseomonas sp. KE2513]
MPPMATAQPPRSVMPTTPDAVVGMAERSFRRAAGARAISASSLSSSPFRAFCQETVGRSGMVQT